MTSNRPLRIAMLAHSTNPRGGVVHAMELANALHQLGHCPVLHAPDPSGKGFFRNVPYETVGISASPATDGLLEMVNQRVSEYISYFSRPGATQFDIYHAQDAISANALATLVASGTIPAFIRTVHHIDTFECEKLQRLHDRAITSADRILCVSRLWLRNLSDCYGIEAELVSNGVNTERFSPVPGEPDRTLRERLGITGTGPVFLSVGGIESRKNSAGILRALSQVLKEQPQAQLVIAGGVTLLDHGQYACEFEKAAEELEISKGPGKQLVITGKIDDRDMPALFRAADALVFPSLVEGFGLVVLEAMASGTPAIVSNIAPFTEFLPEGSCLWVEPRSPESIANAMLAALEPGLSSKLKTAGHEVANQFSWASVAQTHSEIYSRFRLDKRD